MQWIKVKNSIPEKNLKDGEYVVIDGGNINVWVLKNGSFIDKEFSDKITHCIEIPPFPE